MATETLYVNAFDGAKVQWTEVGAIPYLDLIDFNVNYIHDSVNFREEGNFGFDNSGIGAGTITSVIVGIYCQRVGAVDKIQIYIDGINLGAAVPPNAWAWRTRSATAVLDTWAKIDAAVMLLKHIDGNNLVEVDQGRLVITYTPAPTGGMRRNPFGAGLL